MIKFEAVKTNNFTDTNSFVAQRFSKNNADIYTLASNLDYSKDEFNAPTQLGKTLVSIF